jgi:hypothetical protein
MKSTVMPSIDLGTCPPENTWRPGHVRLIPSLLETPCLPDCRLLFGRRALACYTSSLVLDPLVRSPLTGGRVLVLDLPIR